MLSFSWNVVLLKVCFVDFLCNFSFVLVNRKKLNELSQQNFYIDSSNLLPKWNDNALHVMFMLMRPTCSRLNDTVVQCFLSYFRVNLEVFGMRPTSICFFCIRWLRPLRVPLDRPHNNWEGDKSWYNTKWLPVQDGQAL